MAASPSSPSAPSSSIDNCPICWDELSTTCGRTLVTLQCSHKFHLDCIGSTFNSFGEMRCPLCRATESGTWIIPGQRVDEEASEEDDSDTQGFEFEEWDLFPIQGRLMESTRALLYQAFSRPAVLAIGDGTLYHQVSAFDIIHQLNCEWNQPPLSGFNSMLNHYAMTNHTIRVASSTPRATPGHSQGVVDIESYFEPVILEPGRSNGPANYDINWICPPNNSPSPEVRAMMSGRPRGSNGLPERVPAGNAALQSEQAQLNVPPNAPVDRQHQELPTIVQHETDNVSPSENSLDDSDPSLKLLLALDLIQALMSSMDDPLGMDKGGEVGNSQGLRCLEALVRNKAVLKGSIGVR
ncbi:hypothetical protein SLEP1_g127 [Rubroshorea leprosula]|uniref:RING-type domain-containing protein n=1 Tax=Rubroshorea leprosula TaxID=152421 RepID=A0AAV5HJY3_9ROSI|nr:hypothetical protein SLEP1_g127 [Rubroshorea leprosula]